MHSLLKKILIVLALVASGQSARADYSYAFIPGQEDVTLNIGDTFVLDVYLQETVTGTDAPRFTGIDGGLFSAAVAVDFGAAAPAQVIGAADILPNVTDFGDVLAADFPTAGTARIDEQVPLSSLDPVLGTVIAPGVSRIFLGSFRFTALTAGTFTAYLTDSDPSFDETVTAGGYVVDSPSSNIQTGAVRFHVGTSAVPEPASLLMLGIGAASLAGARVRLRSRTIA